MPSILLPGLLAAEAAANRLGVSRATLYCYVSRGLVRAFKSPESPRASLYSAADIESLLERKRRLRHPALAASTALDWGLPVLESGITQIRDGRPAYRGTDALTLAERASLEEAACILWNTPHPGPFAGRRLAVAPHCRTRADNPVQRVLQALAGAGGWPRGLAAQAALLRFVAGAAIGAGPVGGTPIHGYIAQAWRVTMAAGDGIRRALVLCADHELPVSTFAVRVVASTGASLEKAVMAGLGASSGVRHVGGEIDAVQCLFETGRRGCRAREHIITRLGRGEKAVPGFGHPLYAQGDPRAAVLLAQLPLGEVETQFLERVTRETGRRPMLSFALVALERSTGLPAGAAQALFAIGRTVGWIAHAAEQGTDDRVIRPRARYANDGLV